MGQYYYPVILAPGKVKINAAMSPYAYQNGSKLMEHSYLKNNFVQTFEFELSPEGYYHKSRVVWAGDYADKEADGPNLFDQCTEAMMIRPQEKSTEKYRFLVNHTKTQYVDKYEVKELHPLPLLTAEGNGRGGGDYHGNSTLIGTWARDVISVETEVPEGFTKISIE
jgi:hypothetical protein